jgi:homoserine O-acetyltransferase
LSRFQGHATVIGIDSDRLYPLDEQHELARHLQGPDAHASVVHSPYGHDSFLIEHRVVGAMLRDLLDRVARRAGAPR